MKYNSLFIILLLSFYTFIANAGVIRRTSTMSTDENDHPGKLLSKDCFKEGGNEYYYDITPGSTERVCLKHYDNGENGLWEIIQSTNSNCPVGTKKYELLVYCYDNTLTFMRGMYHSKNDDSVAEFGPFRTKLASTTTITSTTTIPMKTTKTVLPTPNLVDITRDRCATKVVTMINHKSKECFKEGGNEYYHDNKPRVCVVPGEVCIKRTGENVEIIYSSYHYCRSGITGEELNECMKTLKKKWTKVLDKDLISTKQLN